ncbi:MAG: hypothetical protein AAF378_24305, partial [Cyanobacteria bacterium P01_A01_bin.84]
MSSITQCSFDYFVAPYHPECPIPILNIQAFWILRLVKIVLLLSGTVVISELIGVETIRVWARSLHQYINPVYLV